MDKYAIFSPVNLNTPSLASLWGFLRHNPRWPKRDKGELLARFCAVELVLLSVFCITLFGDRSGPQHQENYQLVSIRSHGRKKPWTPYEVYTTN